MIVHELVGGRVWACPAWHWLRVQWLSAEAGVESRPSGPTSPSPSQTTSSRPAAQERSAEVLAFEAGKEVMETLRQKQAGVASILEMLLTEMGEDH